MDTDSALPSQSNRILAALAYPIWIIALIIVVTDLKKDPFMRHHGWLALFWAIAWVVLHVAWIVVASLPLLHWLFLFYPLLWPAFIVLSLYYAIQTYNAKSFSIPIVSDWARKYAG
jgi:uncharacterized membrane protein